ncbi:MAG: glycosyltransferase [Kiritimatiellae bacterium]|nr:glycosyltransferase [Kiritimatiellia bacterium]
MFYVHPKIAKSLIHPPAHVRVMTAEPTSDTGLSISSMLRSQLQKICKTHSPHHILLMAFGDLEWSLVWWRCPVPISSILFVQFPEMSSGPKKLFKQLKTRWILHRNPIQNLFLLNGEYSVKYLEKTHRGEVRFHAVPDPVNPLPSGIGVQAPKRGANTVFLYFGAISRRKGFGLLVDAMLKLSEDELQRMKFLFCGRPEDPAYFAHELGRLERSGLPFQLEICKRFLSEEELVGRFVSSDVVLLPYLRPEYSSGVLGIATQTMRPVIGPSQGLLGRLIRGYDLGFACRMCAQELKNALVMATEQGVNFDSEAAKTFAEQSTPTAFARTILDVIKRGRDRE